VIGEFPFFDALKKCSGAVCRNSKQVESEMQLSPREKAINAA
jgi:hypothetical protein